jgi:hypothetical protein
MISKTSDPNIIVHGIKADRKLNDFLSQFD